MKKSSIEYDTPAVGRVYDIADCGPRNCFAANGKLVHNSGGEKLNLQNLPRGGALRRAMCAPEGHTVITCDSAQIEARVLAYVAGQDDLTEAFREGRDAYSEFASKVYGYPVSNCPETKKERQTGKVAILGLGYGLGAAKFPDVLRVMGGVTMAPEEAERVVSMYRQINGKIKQYWRTAENALAAMERGESGTIEGPVPLRYEGTKLYFPNGLLMQYPQLRREDGGMVYEARRGRGTETKYVYGGKLVENVVQGLARIIVFDQMVEIDKALRKLQAIDREHIYRVVSTVHDEVVVIAPDHMAMKIKTLMEKVMSKPPVWASDLPVACEADMGASYGDSK